MAASRHVARWSARVYCGAGEGSQMTTCPEAYAPSEAEAGLGAPGAPAPGALAAAYVIPNTMSPSYRRNDSLSLNCWKSSVSSATSAVITRIRALSCSMRAFCLSELRCAFW